MNSISFPVQAKFSLRKKNNLVKPSAKAFPTTVDNSSDLKDDSALNQIFDYTQGSNPKIKLEVRIDAPLELNLEKALTTALLENLNLKKLENQRDINKWKWWENVSNYLPDYKLGFSAQRFDGNFLVGGVFPVMTLTTSINAYMRLDYRFFEGGKGFFNTLAARKLYNASKYDFESATNDILLECTKAYNRLLREQAYLNVLSKAVEEAKAEVELNENLENQGVGTHFDVLQAQAQLAEQEQQFLVQQVQLREASINLAKILNVEQGIQIKPDQADLTVRKLEKFSKPILAFINIAKENRPEVKSAALSYGAQRNYIASTVSDFLPKANLFGQYGGTGNALFHRTKTKGFTPDAIALDSEGNPVVSMVVRNRDSFQLSGNDLSNVTSVSNVINGGGKPTVVKIDDSLMANKSLGVQIDWDLGMGLGLNTASKINQAKNQARLYKNSTDIVNQAVEQSVRSAYLKLQTSEQLLGVAEKRVVVASEALRLAKLRLENGIGINTELLNAQKQYASALASQVDAVIDYNNSQAELLHSIGLISINNLVTFKR